MVNHPGTVCPFWLITGVPGFWDRKQELTIARTFLSRSDGFVKSLISALRRIPRHCRVRRVRLISPDLRRFELLTCAITMMTFYETVKVWALSFFIALEGCSGFPGQKTGVFADEAAGMCGPASVVHSAGPNFTRMGRNQDIGRIVSIHRLTALHRIMFAAILLVQ